MIELRGKYNIAKVFTDNIESTAISQIIELCNQKNCKDSKIRIMPDTHAGAGCTIGTTMTVKDKIVPNLVGVDIGCGMYVCKIKEKEKEIDLKELDEIIRKHIPSGFHARNSEHAYAKLVHFENLKCKDSLNLQRARISIGTLGGGNHFIEIDKDICGNLYLVVHSGSRYLGKQVAEFYQELGYKCLTKQHMNKEKMQKIIYKLKIEGRQSEIQSELKKLDRSYVNKQLAYVEGENMSDYLNDMIITQYYASLNRMAIAYDICNKMNWHIDTYFTTIHNYIDTKNMILRKGAISAQKGEKVIIPMNMRDGSIIAVGKGNSDWNYSAPHGAGRVMSRSKAKETVSIEEFKNSMNGIYTTSINQSTIDESPMVYKSMWEILANIVDTVDLLKIIKPIYNFKAN